MECPEESKEKEGCGSNTYCQGYRACPRSAAQDMPTDVEDCQKVWQVTKCFWKYRVCERYVNSKECDSGQDKHGCEDGDCSSDVLRADLRCGFHSAFLLFEPSRSMQPLSVGASVDNGVDV